MTREDLIERECCKRWAQWARQEEERAERAEAERDVLRKERDQAFAELGKLLMYPHPAQLVAERDALRALLSKALDDYDTNAGLKDFCQEWDEELWTEIRAATRGKEQSNG